MIQFFLLQTNTQNSTQVLLESLKDSWDNFVANLPSYILALVVLIVGIFLVNKFQNLITKYITKKAPNQLAIKFITQAVRILLIVLVVIIALNIAGFKSTASGLFTALGVTGVLIGIVFKDIAENFVSGIILSFSRPFQKNDTIEVESIVGQVKALELRYTHIKTYDGKDVFVPNTDVIKNPVYNYTSDGFYRLDFSFPLGFDNDVPVSLKKIEDAVNSVDGVLRDDRHSTTASLEAMTGSNFTTKVTFWVATNTFRKESTVIKSNAMDAVKNLVASGQIKTS